MFHHKFAGILRPPTVAAGGPWSPLDLGAALRGWYKADAGVYSDAGTTLAADTEPVEQWNDQSGNEHHLKQNSDGAQPTYSATGFNGQETLVFTPAADGDFLDSYTDAFALGATTTVSVFIVGQLLTGTSPYGRAVAYRGNGQALDYDNVASAYLIARDNTNNGIVGGGSTGNAFAVISLATNYRLGAIFDGANATLYVNNVAGTPGTNTASFTSPGRLLVGNLPEFGSGWDGPISEIIITNTVLSGGELNALDGYLTTKWGL